MKFSSTRRRLTLALASAGFAGLARAETWPSRFITLVLPSSPGSAIDVTARKLAPALAKALGQQIVIDNKPGAGGLIGTAALVKSAPDGYTLGMVSSTFSISPSLYPSSYDPLRDVQPISVLSGGPSVLVVNPANVPATNLKQLIEIAHKRADSSPLTFGNAGNGSTVQLAAAQLSIAAKIKINQVPYKAMSAYATDLIGGVLDAGFLPTIVALPFIRDGRLRPIGTSTGTRVAVLGNVPTLQELGLAGFNVDGWLALMAPAKVPRPILERLNTEIVRALRDPEFVKFATDNGGYVIASSIDDAEKIIAREVHEAARVIKLFGIKAD
jgi:tripartite-type tricarboxylate transporter receptor subunit TctC